MKFFRNRPAGDDSHEEFLSTVQLLDSEVEALHAQIEQLNGHSIELLDRRTAERSHAPIKFDRRGRS